ncbi:MAG: hypothetical protein AAF449_16225 [Myxococcota bacterium]
MWLSCGGGLAAEGAAWMRYEATRLRLAEVEGKLSAAQRLLERPYEPEELTPDEIAERFRNADV